MNLYTKVAQTFALLVAVTRAIVRNIVDNGLNTNRFYYKREGVSHRLTVTYGFVPEFENPEWQCREMFKVKCYLDQKIKGKWVEHSFGLLLGLVQTHAVHLQNIFRWHMRYRDGLPVNYVANAIFYYDIFHETKDAGILKSLINHIGYLDLPDDESFDIREKHEKATLIKWLQERAPKLKALMDSDINKVKSDNSSN